MMTRLDTKFYGFLRKAKDDTTVPESEYVVFLAKDNAFAAILPYYVEKLRELGCDPRQVDSAERLLMRVEAWRAANPDKCKNPDIEPGERVLETGR